MAHGKALEKKIQYSAGAFNGGGEGGKNKANRGHLIVARLSLNPLGDFGLAESDIKKSDKHLLFGDFSIAQQIRRAACKERV